VGDFFIIRKTSSPADESSMHGYPQNLGTSSDYPNSPSPAVKEMLEAEGKRITTVRWLYLLAAVAILVASYLKARLIRWDCSKTVKI
jgi:hypothetical protein